MPTYSLSPIELGGLISQKYNANQNHNPDSSCRPERMVAPPPAAAALLAAWCSEQVGSAPGVGERQAVLDGDRPIGMAASRSVR